MRTMAGAHPPERPCGRGFSLGGLTKAVRGCKKEVNSALQVRPMGIRHFQILINLVKSICIHVHMCVHACYILYVYTV